MNQIRLIGLFYSKRKIRELIVLVQLIVMAVFFAYSADPLVTFFRERIQMDQCYQINYQRMLLFAGNDQFLMDTTNKFRTEAFDVMKRCAGAENVHRIARSYVEYKDSSLKSTRLIIYDQMDDIISLSLRKGKAVHEEGTHYIIVSSEIGKQYPIGSEIEIEFPDFNRSFSCIVSGILKKDAIIPGTGDFSSFTLILGTDISDYKSVIISFDLGDEIKENLSWEQNCLISIPSGIDADEMIDQLYKEQLGLYGGVNKMNESLTASLKATIRDNAPFVFQLVLYALVAIFGYGGYIFLTIETKKKVFQELHLLGTTGNRIFSLYFISNFILLLIACVIGMLGKSFVSGIRYALMEFSVGSWLAFVVLLCMMTGILLLASVIGYWHIRRNMVIGRKEDGEV